MVHVPSSQKKALFSEKLSAILTPYKMRFETILKSRCARGDFGLSGNMQKASEYALSSGGKRFRPAIVWMVGEALDCNKSVLDDAALAVEYFHTASMIADDLPCMDNDDFRRGVPTVHKAFGEATAVLASFSLIALGFESIANVAQQRSMSPDAHRQAVLVASRTMGARGLLGGQEIDLQPPNTSLETIEQIIDMKTGALFELSFTLGWLFSGGESQRLSDVKRLAQDFGRAFQIFDDIDDYEQDSAQNKMINYAVRFGMAAAIDAVKIYVERVISGIQQLGLYDGMMADRHHLALLANLLYHGCSDRP